MEASIITRGHAAGDDQNYGLAGAQPISPCGRNDNMGFARKDVPWITFLIHFTNPLTYY